MTKLEHKSAFEFINTHWDEQILPELIEYIRIPNKSPLFDAQWSENGHMDQAVELFRRWCEAQDLPGVTIDVLRDEGRTPLLFIEIPGDCSGEILFYGHLDKQPEMEGWEEGLGPWIPVIKNDRLYGRGGADDGYACFSALTAVMALRKQNICHSRCVVLIEASEESGSRDLPHYLNRLSARIGNPDLVVCLDAGACNYDQMWLSTSLRGNLTGVLTVKMLKEGVHSGVASGAVASTFRITREILSRLEDSKTGRILLDGLHVDIPKDRIAEVENVVEILGDDIHSLFPLVDGGKLMSSQSKDILLGTTWWPTLSYTGVAGLPAIGDAGNVLRPYTSLKLAFRLPPTLDSRQAASEIKELLELNPPYDAEIKFDVDSAMDGWNASSLSPWLSEAVNSASLAAYGRPVAMLGLGGSIPFMSMLGRMYPDAQFVITGVLGPNSNAHGPNEFLDIPFAKRLTLAIADIVCNFSNANDLN